MIKLKLLKLTFILFSIIIFSSLFFHNVFGEIKTASLPATISPTGKIDEKDIQNFKEKVATKVSELRERNNKAVSGFVIEKNDLGLTIADENEVKYQIKPDESLTKYYQILGSQTKEIKLSDIDKDSFIIVTGVVNDEVITANIIYIDEMFLVKSGKITEVNKENYQLKVLSSEKDTYTLDIETTTKQQMINIKTFAPETSGFSKIKEGDTIHFVAKKSSKEKNNPLKAVKILIIPQEFFIK